MNDTKLLIVLYCLLGILFTLQKLPHWYISILLFIAIKMIFNYRKCTISYIECKIRGVTKDLGYINSILDPIVDLRSTDMFPWLLLYTVLTVYCYLYVQKQRLLPK